jgi:glycosyltransferase involved in cell wall biosynthesis
MLELDELPISVVIPTYNNKKSFENVLDAVYKQTIRPKQIVIIDSSDVNEIEINLHKYNDNIKIEYIKVERFFPGRARNLGVQIASEKYVAFLDSKTIPNRNWLSSSFAMLRDYDVVFGSVHYRGVSNFQKLISASIYGENNIKSISGTLMLKSVFLKIGFFNEKTRAGEDLDWKARVKESEFNYYVPALANTVYSEISSNLIMHMKRAFFYQMHSAFVDIQHSTRAVFLSVFILLLATLAPSWNDLIFDYKNKILFIPHLLKFFLFFLGLFVILSIICLKLSLVNIRNRRFLIFLVNLSLFVWFFVVVYNWNTAIPVWDESSPFFVPHITKLYLATLLALSFIIRGIILPIKRGVHKKYLFPYRWAVIGLIGVILDISKSPGYFMGSLVVVYRKVKSKFRDRKNNKE